MGISIASAMGLNTLLCDPLADRSDGEGGELLGANEPRRDGVSGTRPVRGTGRNASADHSYQTCRVFVSRQREMVTSELLGRYNGSYMKVSTTYHLMEATRPSMEKTEGTS